MKRRLHMLCVFGLFAQGGCLKKAPDAAVAHLSSEDSQVHITFDEARELFLRTHRVHDIHQDPAPQGQSTISRAQRKFRELMRRPFVYQNPLAPRPKVESIIKGLQWNILYGAHVDTIGAMLAGDYPRLSFRDITTIAPLGPALGWLHKKQLASKTDRLNQEAAAIKAPDFMVLNEVDWGLGRSGYRNVAKELAQRLNMHYAFATNYLEIDNFFSIAPSFEKEARELLRVMSSSKDKEVRELTGPYQEWLRKLKVDENRFRGLSGNAILSRYPIRQAYIINTPLSLQFKDWFEEEKQKLTMTEWLKRFLIKGVYSSERVAMVRYGMDNTLVAELVVPGMPNQTLTVATFHPEIFATPDQRRRQIEYAVGQLQDLRGPVVFAGDMNTSGHDGTNWSAGYLMKRTLTNPHSWFSFTLNQLMAGAGTLTSGLNYLKNFQDPTAVHIPGVAPNPEKKLFDFMGSFRFSDGGQFDQASLHNRPLKPDSWGMSNERDQTGFVPTFETNRNFFQTGAFKLDWFFVKPALGGSGSSAKLGSPVDSRVARHFNRQVIPPGQHQQDSLWTDERVSDHNPSVIWLRGAPKN